MKYSRLNHKGRTPLGIISAALLLFSLSAPSIVQAQIAQLPPPPPIPLPVPLPAPGPIPAPVPAPIPLP